MQPTVPPRLLRRQQRRSIMRLALLLALAAAAASVAAVNAAARPLLTTPPPAPSPPSPPPAASSFDPTTLGPCGPPAVVATTLLTLDPLAGSGCKGAGCKLTVTVTAGAGASTAERCTRPLPVVLVLPGFAARASMYAPYAELLASWGYAAVSYEAPLLASFPPLKDAYEGSEPFVALVARSAAGALAAAPAASSSSPLRRRLDPRSLAKPMAVGHSRGGKIAALGLASGALSTAALLDPVDGGLAPFFPPSPSAVAALRASPPAGGALVVQAGVQGPCNCAMVGGDSLFWKALVDGGGGGGGGGGGAGGGGNNSTSGSGSGGSNDNSSSSAASSSSSSWRAVLPKAGHGAFAALGPFQPIAGALCGGVAKLGGLSERKAVQLSRTLAMEWIEKSWEGQEERGRGGGGGNGPLPAEAAFCDFVARKAEYMTPVERADGTSVCPPSSSAAAGAAAAAAAAVAATRRL
jgi:hypothetical protein